MQALSDRQLRQITKAIEDHHNAFIVNVLGEDAIPEAEVERLRRKGLIDPLAKSLPEDSFYFGILADALEEADAKDMDLKAFKSFLAKKPVPLTTEERYAVKHLKRSLAMHIKGLGNTIDKRTNQILVEADQGLRRRLSATVKHTVIEGVERRKTVQEIATELRKATKDYARDWTRVVATELNNGYQEGKLQNIIKANKERDPLVFKRPRPDCCDECREHYLDKSGAPRIFRLSELMNNGSNVGRKRDIRKAVVSSHHPFCQCELHELPPGFEFDDTGTMVWAGLS